MKYLKIYEDFENIHSICNKYGIGNYTINDDGSIDVDGYVNLQYKSLTKIPLKFGNVSGHFYCGNNYITSLEGCPKSVGGFYCSNNQITSLEGCPKSVSGGFYCCSNQITSLEGCPNNVGGVFECDYNKLESLEGCPKSVGGGFYCRNNQITSLEGFPKHIGGYFYCGDNPVCEIWKLFGRKDKIELFNDYDIIREDRTIVLDRLNAFLEQIGKPTVEKVEGYKII